MKPSFATAWTLATALTFIECQSTSSASLASLISPTSTRSANGPPSYLPGDLWPRGKSATISVLKTAKTADLATPSATITSTVTSGACELLLPFSNVLTTYFGSPDSTRSYPIGSTSSHRTSLPIPTKTANAHVLGQSTQQTGAKAVSGTKKSASPSASISAKGAIKKRDNKVVSVDARRSIRTGDTNGLFNRIFDKHRRRDLVARTEAEREKNGATTALVRRVDHSDTWKKCAAAGLRYWNEFNTRALDQPDRVLCNFDATYHSETSEAKPAKPFRPFLNKLGIPAEHFYYNVFASHPKEDGEGGNSDFTNLFSPEEGVIIASANQRQIEPNKPPAPDHWLTIAWYLWKKACISAKSGTHDVLNLKYIVQRDIDNEATGALFGKIIKQEKNYEPGKFVTRKPSDTNTDTNWFWALLRSPNGNGMIHLLTDNKIALHGKSIVQIGFWQDPSKPRNSGYETHMWVELT